jgi:hypothetical protein
MNRTVIGVHAGGEIYGEGITHRIAAQEEGRTLVNRAVSDWTIPINVHEEPVFKGIAGLELHRDGIAFGYDYRRVRVCSSRVPCLRIPKEVYAARNRMSSRNRKNGRRKQRVNNQVYQ